MLARKLNEVLGKRQLFSRVIFDADAVVVVVGTGSTGPASRDGLAEAEVDVVAGSTGATREAAADVGTMLPSSFASSAAFGFSTGGRGASRMSAGHTTDTTLLRRLAVRHMQLE